MAEATMHVDLSDSPPSPPESPGINPPGGGSGGQLPPPSDPRERAEEDDGLVRVTADYFPANYHAVLGFAEAMGDTVTDTLNRLPLMGESLLEIIDAGGGTFRMRTKSGAQIALAIVITKDER